MAEENRNSRFERCACILILAVLMLFFASILITVSARQILVKQMGLSNRFTEILFFGNPHLNDAGAVPAEPDGTVVQIDWEALYPFPEQAGESAADGSPVFLRLYEKQVRKLEDKTSAFATRHLKGYTRIVELAKRYEKLIGWAYVSYREYNGVVLLPDGMLATFVEKKNVSSGTASAAEFAEYCHARGIEFLYVQVPGKISETSDRGISGSVDFSNQNADELVRGLRAAGVDVLDLREAIEAEGLDHHALFYRTDHHWRVETGLWAARHILEYCRREYQMDVDPELLRADRFTRVVYPDYFLGSFGKKATLSVTEPEDFSLLYPRYETSVYYSVLNRQAETEGDFSVLYDLRKLETVDYYGQNPYLTFMGGDYAQAVIENRMEPNDLRILVIDDSFGDCVLPFLSLGVSRVDVLDLRVFTGSVKRYMEECRPDLVIVQYYPASLCEVYGNNQDTFDFR